MSHRGIAWAWSRKGVTTTQKCVLLALGEAHGHYDGVCRPGIETLAEMAELSHRQARRVIRDLVELKHIEIAEEGTGRRAHRYMLVGLDDGEGDSVVGTPTTPQADLESEPESTVVGTPMSPQDPRRDEAPETVVGTPVTPQGGHPGSVVGTPVTPASGHRVFTSGGGRACAREAPPPPGGDHLTAGQFVETVDPPTRAELVDARPELAGHLEAFLATFAKKRAGTGRRTAEAWLPILWDWWQREEPPDAQAAWDAIRPRLTNAGRAYTDDPVAAAVIADMGGFSALGRQSERELVYAERDFLTRYRALERGPPRDRQGPRATHPPNEIHVEHREANRS